jgi:hypothetical protein
MKKAFGLGLLLLCVFGLIAAPAFADSAFEHIVCTGTTVCTSGATTLVTSSTSTPTFNLVNEDGLVTGTAFLAVLVPNGTASFTVKEGVTTIPLEESITFTSGKLGDSGNLNEPGLGDFQFSALSSASGQAGVDANSLTVYEYNLGAYSGSGGNPGITDLSAGVLPTGTVIVSWVEDSNGTSLIRTPLSESLTVTPPTATPEPSSSFLLSLALLGIGFCARKFAQRIG